MPKCAADYSRTAIYKLCCLNLDIKDIYIGHTTNFVKRKNHHKFSCNTTTHNKSDQFVYRFIRDNGGWSNWKMVQIEEINCSNKREAEAREHYWIVVLGATLNCILPYAMCKENPVEYKKEWYQLNKEEVLEKAGQNYDINKEYKLLYQKEYAEKNKDKLKVYNDQYREEK